MPTDKICGRSLSSMISIDMNSIFMKLYVTWFRSHTSDICIFESDFCSFLTVPKLLNNLNVCSGHNYVYPRSRFKTIYMYLITLFIFHCHNVNWDEHRLQQFKPSGQKTKIENWKTRHIWFHICFFARDRIVALFNLYACSVVVFLYSDCHFWMI